MSDHTVSVGVVVDVKGEEKLKALGKDINAANKQATSAIKIADTVARSQAAAIPTIKQATAANAAQLAVLERNERVAKSIARRTNVSYAQALADTTRANPPPGGAPAAAIAQAVAPVAAQSIKQAVASAVGTEVGAFASFAGGAAKAAVGVAAVATGFVALAGAAVAAVAGIGAVVAAFKLMKASVAWANEAADKTTDTFNRMFKNRTTFAQEAERNAVGVELIGKGFDDLNDKIKDSKFFKSDFAKNWGMTQSVLDKFGAKQPGAPGRTRQTDTLDVLEKAVAKREELEKRFADAVPGSKKSKDAMAKMRLFSDDLEDFDSDFAKAARVLSSKDIAAAKDGMKKIAAVTFTPENQRAALDYKRAMFELNSTFDMLKFNIGSAVMPTISSAVRNLTQSLQGVAPQLSRLGSAVAGKGWEVISAVLGRLGVAVEGSGLKEIINSLSKSVEGVSAENIASKITGVVSGLGEVASAIIAIGDAISSTKEYLNWANEQRKLVRPEEAKESLAKAFDPFRTKPLPEGAGPFDKFQAPLQVEVTNPIDINEVKLPSRRPVDGVPSDPLTGAIPTPRARPAEAGPSAADLASVLEQGGQKAGQSIESSSQKAAAAVSTGGTTGGNNFSSVIAAIGWAGFGAAFGQAAAAAISAAAANIKVNVSGAGGAPSKGPDVPSGTAPATP